MNKIKIHTRFDVAHRKNENKVFDRHDNVDRLSYVDNTMMIKRFVQEGRSLAEARAKALRSGTYLNYKDAMSDDSGIATPVYAMDPALADPIIEKMTTKLSETSSVGADKADVKDNVSQPTEEVTKPSTVSE